MYMSIGMVLVGAALAIAAAVRRLIEIAPGTDVAVTVPLSGESAQLPLGPDGAAVLATVDTATVVVPDPAPATLFALWAQPIWDAALICALLMLVALFFLRLARGLAFAPHAGRLPYAAAAVVTVGWLGSGILTNMTTNGALSAISDYTYDSAIFEVSLAPVLALMVLAAMGAALQAGERLQRDTDGLV
jgi:methyl coenzyme M reductase beta subunit